MDQLIIGKFIAQQRKERGLTQRELAELLAISDKTVSKWECGGGLPEVSLMLPLCKELGITVNELLTGKRLISSEYQKNAEANIMKLIQEKEENKRKVILGAVVVFITLLAGLSLILISGLAELTVPWRIALIVIALIVIFGGIFVAVALEMTSSYFECMKCHHRFLVKPTSYIMAMHTITRRYLKCPKCGIRNWCKRRLTLHSDEEEEA